MKFLVTICFAFFVIINCTAQELLISPSYNTQLQNSNHFFAKKKRSLSLPFFEDFTNYAISPYPDNTKWLDNKVYINNTFCIAPIAKGVATFDGFNEKGLPYYPNNTVLQYKADSLTSQYFDLSTLIPNDSLYLSFYWQCQGNGFSPELTDSLLLYFRTNANTWQRIWGMNGGGYTDFSQVNLPVINPSFFHDSFQFRFVNIASPNTNDDVWNIDYVRFNKNRNLYDTLADDITFTDEPQNFLKNITSIPYRQYTNHRLNLANFDFRAYIRNNTFNNHNVNVEFEAREKNTNTIVASGNTNHVLFGLGADDVIHTVYNNTYTPVNINNKVVIEHKYYIVGNPNIDSKTNDTIVLNHIFDNYIAYDDGSMEKAYTLLPAFGLPAKTAMSFHLYEPDTIAGLMIRFGNQTPTALGKQFTISLYKKFGSITQPDDIIYSQQQFTVNYSDTINGFTYYAFDTIQNLDTGTYYIGTTQPTFANIDTLYFGFDANTNQNSNMFYYNVDGNWYNSTVIGTVMMRPVLGGKFVSTSISNTIKNNKIELYPNPSNNTIFIKSKDLSNQYSIQIFDIIGKEINPIKYSKQENQININNLPKGVYLLHIHSNNSTYIKKFIKE